MKTIKGEFMATAKPAPITINEGDKELLRIESDKLFRVLYVEDEEVIRTGIEARFKDEGLNIDVVPFPSDAAELLEPDKYHLLIMDILFDFPNISGDEFVFKNQDVLENVIKVAFTGNAGKIKYNNLFDEVIPKGKNQQLVDFATRLFEERETEFKTTLKDSANNFLQGNVINIGNYQIAEEKIKRLQEKLISELEKVGDRQKKLVTYKGESYSAKRLIEEIKKGSEVGQAHIGMMMDLMEENV